MACGVPIVASPVGVNVGIVTESGAGRLARSSIEWRDAISAFLKDDPHRSVAGQMGRAAVYETYSLRAQLPRLAQVLRDAGNV